MRRVSIPLVLSCVVAATLAGCGSSGKHATTSAVARSPLATLKSCFERRGYVVDVEPANVRRTAPSSFEFVAVWNLLNPNRIALAVTVSKTDAGAKRANAWTTKTNKRIAKGAVRAPVVRFGRINVLWTTDPDPRDTTGIYGCVRKST